MMCKIFIKYKGVRRIRQNGGFPLKKSLTLDILEKQEGVFPKLPQGVVKNYP